MIIEIKIQKTICAQLSMYKYSTVKRYLQMLYRLNTCCQLMVAGLSGARGARALLPVVTGREHAQGRVIILHPPTEEMIARGYRMIQASV